MPCLAKSQGQDAACAFNDAIIYRASSEMPASLGGVLTHKKSTCHQAPRLKASAVNKLSYNIYNLGWSVRTHVLTGYQSYVMSDT